MKLFEEKFPPQSELPTPVTEFPGHNVISFPRGMDHWVKYSHCPAENDLILFCLRESRATTGVEILSPWKQMAF